MDENSILTSIMSAIATMNSSLTEQFFDDVIKRLESLGYVVTDSDVWLLSFTAKKVEQDIISSCNTLVVPDGLYYNMVDMVCGEFLFTKKRTGQLTGFDFGDAVKQIQEGDTSITFIDGLSAEQQFDSVINSLKDDKGMFVSYRQLSW